MFDYLTGNRTRLTFGGRVTQAGWAPGNRVVYESGAPGMSTQSVVNLISAEGGGQPRQLVVNAYDAQVSADGCWVVYYRIRAETGADIYALPLDPQSLTPLRADAEQVVARTPSNERSPKVHPSGAYLAYLGQETGQNELYLTRFPSGEGKWQVSTGGADYATWTARGDALMYSHGARIIEVPMTFQPAVALGAPRVAFERGSTRAVLGAGFDVMNDGRTLVFKRVPPSAGEMTGVITVVQNWLEDFRSTAR